VSVTAAKGFTAAGVVAGLKPSGSRDLALVVNTGPLAVAGAVYTANRCKANPVLWSEQASADGIVRAVILNSGGANCFTGPAGFATTHATAEQVAAGLGIGAGDVVVCSTGLIGQELRPDLMAGGVESVVAALSDTGGDEAAQAIMTTDTVAKQVVVEGTGWVVGGMAKGAAMLAPGLATMLVVLTCDAEPPAGTDLSALLRSACSGTLERLDSDGCMSTNDTVVLMVSGASGVAVDPAALESAVTSALDQLGRQLIADAEGAQHDIAITVTNAVSEADAVEVARAVSRSSLFKCAVFGQDPNWGRVVAAVGTTQAAFDPSELDVVFNGVQVCRAAGIGDDPATVDLSGREVHVLIDLHAGTAEATVWTNDLTYGYVQENAEYST
jgi:glutamate N-acetyltransferase / amino-acid N-acetyltransferase